MKVITRFAPSPTGFLHIGGARTALFNYLFAKHNNGLFLLRIEDTDKDRNNQQAVDAIMEGMKWLDLNWDGDVIFQQQREERHREVAFELLNKGMAYYCYHTPEELELLRQESKSFGKPIRSKWRDHNNEAPPGIKPVIRLKAPLQGKTVVNDCILGDIVTENENLEDFIILRSDGSPIYNLAVVVDDHDMGITHVIRGDDHLTNAARQKLIYQALGWPIPQFAHIPLIHGPDGTKLSKRHGALAIQAYQEMGYLPEAMGNYLLRLGWSHGNEEFIDRVKAVEWFNLEAIGKSPARLDFKKMDNVNAHYLKSTENKKLIDLCRKFWALIPNNNQIEKIEMLMPQLKLRAKTIAELAHSCDFIMNEQNNIEPEAKHILESNNYLLQNIINELQLLVKFDKETTIDLAKKLADEQGLKLADIAQIIRAALTGSIVSISVFEIMPILGKEESLRRLKLYA